MATTLELISSTNCAYCQYPRLQINLRHQKDIGRCILRSILPFDCRSILHYDRDYDYDYDHGYDYDYDHGYDYDYDLQED